MDLKSFCIIAAFVVCCCHAWDSVLFSQSWPVALCRDRFQKNPNVQCNIPPQGKWSIHGVWPSNNDRSLQNECHGNERFDARQIESIRDAMRVQWPDIYGKNDHGFWRHEWESHGKCGVDIPELSNMLSYFKKALEWNKQYDLAIILARNNIYPDNSKLVSVDSIQNAVKRDLGVTPKIRCLNQNVLQEIRLCFDERLQLTNCFGRPNCDKMVYYYSHWKDDADNEVNPKTKAGPGSGSKIFLSTACFFVGLFSIFVNMY